MLRHKFKKHAFVLLLVLVGTLPGPLSARPVPFKAAWNLMLEHQGAETHFMGHYGLSRNWSGGWHFMQTEADGRGITGYFAQANYLVKRWNTPGAQTNLYLLGGAGAYKLEDRFEPGGFIGAQFDAENRRLYTAWRFTHWQDTGEIIDRQTGYGRVGWAPYEAGYDELNTWLIFQAAYTSDAEDEMAYTPLVRFFYRDWLVELGSSFDGQVLANINYTLYF